MIETGPAEKLPVYPTPGQGTRRLFLGGPGHTVTTGVPECWLRT